MAIDTPPTRSRRRGVQGIVPARLERELTARRLDWSDLGVSQGGPFAPGTVRKLRSGQPIQSETLERLVKFLEGRQVDPLMARLMGLTGTPAA